MGLTTGRRQSLLPYRQTTPTTVSVFRRFVSGLGLTEALQKTAAEDKTLASSTALSVILIYTNEWKMVKGAFPCMTGTMAAYRKPDARLGSSIEFVDERTGLEYIFIVPVEYKNYTNTLLIVEHPNFSLEADRNRRIIRPHPRMVAAIENFPEVDGFYHAHEKYDMPAGKRVISSALSVVNYDVQTSADRGREQGLRYLKRIAKHVGPAIRSLENPRCIDLTCPPSGQFGIFVNDL